MVIDENFVETLMKELYRVVHAESIRIALQ